MEGDRERGREGGRNMSGSYCPLRLKDAWIKLRLEILIFSRLSLSRLFLIDLTFSGSE